MRRRERERDVKRRDPENEMAVLDKIKQKRQ